MMKLHTKIKSLMKFYQHDIHIHTFKNRKNTLHVTGASCIGSSVIAIGKLAMGVVSMSFFTCVCAMYSFAMVLAKLYVLYGISQTTNHIPQQYDYYKRSGKLLVIAGTAYIIYAINLFLFPVTSHFDQNTALLIASFTFVELGLNIRGIIVERKNKMPLFHALKIINLASSCICLVLTQTALLAYTAVETGVMNDASSNGLMGILMGVLSTMLGVYLVLRSQRIQEGRDYERICKRIDKIIQKKKFDVSLHPIQIYMDEQGKRFLEIEEVTIQDERIKEELYHSIFTTLNIAIVEGNDIIKKKEVAR